MEIKSEDFEKLGVFYLGQTVDLDRPEEPGHLLLYDSKDLTTHAVVLGMTGSGKTGLCIGLLEEAGIDRIPAIVIDPKGDIANLLLTFPNLSQEEFEPWVDPGQATRAGLSIPEFAAHEAEKWKKGLERSGQDVERIRKLRETVDFRVYTPGSTAGRPMTILKCFSAPPQVVIDDSDAFRERISATTSGLLALLGIDADPIRSREHIFISQLLQAAWSEGNNLDLGGLIKQIQNPPFKTVGVMELDSFFPAKDRTALAMTLNNLLASPSFAAWMQGESLDVNKLLHDAQGKPSVSILSIAHLSDAERMFFVTILLNEVLAWVRTQAGTSSLRAILYMDEVFGFFPPVQNPPSKLPMLTLLKQARAFGLGVVLATQNPGDLDYKGLANIGTWFLGRLQAERDKARVLDGLEGAAAASGNSFKRAELDKLLSGLSARRFLMNNAHENHPVVFQTRWCMSYLRGPLTRQHLQKLTQAEVVSASSESTSIESPITVPVSLAPDAAPPAPVPTATPGISPREMIPAGMPQYHWEFNRRLASGESVIYEAGIYARGALRYTKSTAAYRVDEWVEKRLLLSGLDERPSVEMWDRAEALEERPILCDRPVEEARYAEPVSHLISPKKIEALSKDLKEFLYRRERYDVYFCKETKTYSNPGESEGDFRFRLEGIVSEIRDRETEKLRERFQSRFDAVKLKIERAETTVQQKQQNVTSRRIETVLNVGTTLMGALLGRRTGRSAATTVRDLGSTSKEKTSAAIAETRLEDAKREYEDLERDFNRQMADVAAKSNVDQLTIETITIPPRKTDISIEEFCVVWVPRVLVNRV